jgi:ketosteroid isomerase-like protein
VTRPPAEKPELSMQNKDAVVLALFRAVEERDREALLELYHDDLEVHDAPSLPYGGTVSGKAAMREQVDSASETTWLGTWGPLQPTEDERRMDPRVVGTNGDEVTVIYIQRALSPAGERLASPVLALYEVRDDKVARAQMFHYDTAAILAFIERAAAAAHRGPPLPPG